MEDKIIDYVAQTPENTNPAVLNTLLGDLNKQSDWNQNDETQPDYVKNRPFYTGDFVETEIIPKITVTFTEREGFMTATWPESFDAVEGQTYKISWDGTDYVCTCVFFNGEILFLGNLALIGVGDDTGESFIFMKQGRWLVGTTESATEHVISISEYAKQIVQIDEKYLPESAFTKAEWSNISNKIVDYKQQSLSLSVNGESIKIGAGINYSKNRINDKLKFEDGMAYEINGSIIFYSPNLERVYTLDVNGRYTYSNGEVNFGSFYDKDYRKDIKISLHSSSSDDDPYHYGYLEANAVFSSVETYTFDINITVTAEAKQLPDICIDTNIQRVGDDVIIPSSTANSTKKFKITVDDSGAITTTEVT